MSVRHDPGRLTSPLAAVDTAPGHKAGRAGANIHAEEWGQVTGRNPVGSVTVDCTDVGKVAEFWSAALDIALDPDPSPYLASLNRNAEQLPRFLFIKVPEGKTAKNRMHLDLLVEDSGSRDDEVAMVALGATHVADKDEWGHSWAVLTEPEGNEFCVSARS